MELATRANKLSCLQSGFEDAELWPVDRDPSAKYLGRQVDEPVLYGWLQWSAPHRHTARMKAVRESVWPCMDGQLLHSCYRQKRDLTLFRGVPGSEV